MLLKLIFSLASILILCSLDKVFTKAINSTDDNVGDYPEDEQYSYTLILIPYYNLSSIDEPSERDKLVSFVIQELELLAPKINKNSPLILHYDRDYSNDEDYEEEEEEEEDYSEASHTNGTEIGIDTQTEVDVENETQTPTIFDPELQAACKEFLNKVLLASEKYWNSLSKEEQAKNEEFNEWLKQFKDTNDVLESMDLLNQLFYLTGYLMEYN